MNFVRLNISQVVADELSHKLEVALAPTPEELIAALDIKFADLDASMSDIGARVSTLEASVLELQAAPQAPQAPETSRKIWFAETPTGAERTLNMVATGPAGNPQDFYVIYSLPLPNIKAGDLIEAHAQWEVTNDNSAVYMIGGMLIIGNSLTDDYPGSGKIFSRPRTENLTNVMHHMRLNEHGSRLATADMTGKFINLLCYCAGQNAGAIIRVEPNYGSLEVKVTPKEMLA